jgi:hypothetical protein
MNAKPTNPQITAADLDAALASEADNILPSSGFADNVMAAVYHEATVPAPIPFPWKRAIPGLVAAVAAVVLLCALLPSILHTLSVSAGRAPAASNSFFLNALHSPLSAQLSYHATDAAWLGTSVVICLACLAFCRRLVSSR